MENHSAKLLTALKQFSASTTSLYELWDSLREQDPETAFDADQEYPFVETFDQVTEQIVKWVDHQIELAEKKEQWK